MHGGASILKFQGLREKQGHRVDWVSGIQNTTVALLGKQI